MSLRERLIIALGGYTSLKEADASYIDKIPHVNLPNDTEIDGHEVREYLDVALADIGFTKGQKIAISSVLGKTDFARGGRPHLTIDDIRKMSDQEILGLRIEWSKGSWRPRQRTVSILRQLFGRDS